MLSLFDASLGLEAPDPRCEAPSAGVKAVSGYIVKYHFGNKRVGTEY
jgi:hypothetical protein